MKSSAIQLQPGMSMPEFLERYGTESLCEQALTELRWPHGFRCERCAGNRCRTFRRGGQPLFECVACRHQTSLRAGTLLAHSKVPLRLWFLAVYLLTQTKTNLSALELHRHLGVAAATAWRMKHKLMQCMVDIEANRQLDGVVQIDDAYLGGERNGGKRGRGSENKIAFVIALSTSDDGRPREVVLTPLKGFTKASLATWMTDHLAPECEVYTDGLGAFGVAADAGHAHTVVVTAGGRAACTSSSMRWVNTVLSNVKRAIDGRYHAFKFAKYARRYLSEAAWRFNRRFNLAIMVPTLLGHITQSRPQTEAQLRVQNAYY